MTCAFFGMLFVIGAIAALASGRLNPHIPAQALRGGLTLGLGLASFLISMVLLKRARCRRM